MLKKFPRHCANPLPQSSGASRRDQPIIPLHTAQIYQTEGIGSFTHSKMCEKLLTIRFKLKNLHLQSVTFLALYTFVKKAFMSAKTFVKINILPDSISIHVEINMNSDGDQTERIGL